MADKKKTSEKVKKLRFEVIKTTPYWKSRIIDRFEEMEEFKRFTFSAIDEEKKSVEEYLEEVTEGMSKEELDEFYDWGGEDHFMVKSVFEKTSLNSFIVILYSYIEIGINTLCKGRYSDKRMEQMKKNKQAEDEGRKPEFKELYGIKSADVKVKGGIIKRAKKYLEKEFDVSFDSVKEEWDEIIGLGKLRNSIVHNDGVDEKEDVEKDNKIKEHVKDGMLGITGKNKLSYGRIVIKREYLDTILPVVRKFFSKLEV